MRKTFICISAITVLLVSLLCAFAFADDIENLTDEGNNAFFCSYGGMTRRFSEYTPDGEVKGIILMLHGYGSDMNAFRLTAGIDGPANERGYCAVYVNGVPNPDDYVSSTGWNSGIGESPVDDMGFLAALAQFLQGKYGLTKDETFAAGFSNGAFMLYRIAVEGQDSFAGVASVAGMMPEAMWNTKGDRTEMSVLQINGTKDDAVPMNLNGTAKYAKAPAIEDVLGWLAESNGLSEEETSSLSARAQLTKRSGEGSGQQVWQVLIKDGRHSWPEEKYCGFDVCGLILDFFDSVRG